MSTLRMLKDHKRGKKGEVVTCPFLEARELVAAGIAERPGEIKTVPPPTDLATSAVIEATPIPADSVMAMEQPGPTEESAETDGSSEDVRAFKRRRRPAVET